MVILGCGAELKALMAVSDSDVGVIEDTISERMGMGMNRKDAQRQGVAEAIAVMLEERAALMDAVGKKVAELRAKPVKRSPEADHKAAMADVAKRRAGQAVEAQPAAKIEDSGQVLEGARKLYAKAYQAKLDESLGVDIASVPLSKSWPEPDYQKLLDEGASPWAVALAHAARDVVPTKPVKAWKLKGWVESVQALREMTMKAMDGDSPTYTKENFLSKMQGMKPLLNKIDLYEAAGHERSLKAMTFSEGQFGMYGGQKFSPAKTMWIVTETSNSASASWMNGNWGKEIAIGDTKEQALEKFKAWYAAQVEKPAEAAKGTVFDIYSYRNKPGVFIIGKRLTALKSIDLKTFPTAQEARKYKTENQAELEALLAKEKYEPPERRENNAPRVGIDHRNGADVTTEQFRETFGFRGEQFGASMPQGERQSNLNQSYDALMDLAGVVGIPPKALSLNGELGLAFGARGRGGKNAPMAHYEPDVTGEVTPSRVVINLTRNKGAGTLAHEWFHAVDNYFARMRGEKGEYVTMHPNEWRGEGVRPEMIVAFKELMKTINLTGIKERSKELDKKRTKDYWSTGLEMAARSFESYVIAKLQDQNASNDYLANIVNETLYALQGAYPYPSMGEIPQIRAAFDHFFDTVQTKETDQGAAMFSRQDDGVNPNGQPADKVQALADQITAKWANAPKVIVVQSHSDPRLPADTKPDADGLITPDGTAYLIADKLASDADTVRVLMHESLGHFGLRGLYGEQLGTVLDRMAVLNTEKVKQAAARLGFDYSKLAERRMAAEEVLAYMAQTLPEQGWVHSAVAAIRTWLRENIPGFKGLGLSDSELIRNYITPARRWVENGGPKGAQSVTSDTRTAFSQSDESPEARAAEQLSQTDELFALPKSQAATVQEIARDNNPLIQVRESKVMSETLYTLTMPNQGGIVKLWVRPASKYGEHIYSMDLADGEMGNATIGRPGDNPEDVETGVEDVFLDVSGLKEGGGGAVLYNIASTFAHNTGKIFIGDPSGLTDAAMRRRLENMISTALKFGTTDHIAPHPYQVQGKDSIGVPPLQWVYGDTLGNIKRMIDVSLKAEETSGKVPYEFDTTTGYFTDPGHSGAPVAGVAGPASERLQDISDALKERSRTRARAAIFNALLRESGQGAGAGIRGRDGLLARLVHVQDQFPVRTRGIFYSRNLGEALTSGVNNVRDVKLAAGYVVGDLFHGEGRLGWWHKSVGTMHNLAQKSPPFKRVYDSIQNFLNDTSYYAAEAADLAPNILPKLDKMRDVLKSPLSAADTKALSAPVFEGTLAWGRDENGKAVRVEDADTKTKPGIVFTPAELKQHFQLSDAQVKLYQEFRTATDKSIDNLAISEMLNYAGKDAEAIRDMVLAEPSVQDAAQMLRDYLVSQVTLQPERDEALSATAAKMLDVAAHATDMKERGYAPLSRFGNYTLEGTLPTGERYFSMFETDRERNKMSRLLAAEGATGIKTGTMSQEAYKLLNGINPETAALFGEMLGMDSQGSEAKDLAFQEFIKRGTANRSAMKRLIHRKGIAGFSEDSGRVLAGFIYSNARRTASNLHGKETASAVNDIPKEQGELKDAAVKLSEYVGNPQEEMQAFRGLLFAQYLGGSVASAMINATQPFTVTLPYLSQYGGIRKAAAQMAAAVRDATRGATGNAPLDAALKKAEEDGIVSPQEVHSLQAQAMGKAQLKSGDGTTLGDAMARGSNALSKLTLAWGKVFGLAEQFNRRTTFIAAYRTAIEQGIANPAAFAAKAVGETQFTYNKGNKPRWARGAVGSVLFTFKQYSVNYLELVTRMATAGEPGSAERLAGQKAAVLAIAILFMMAGSEGLPFVEDIEDVIDGAMQRLGYNFSSKQRMKQFLTLQLGKDGAEFLTSGISGLPGAPIDVSGRLGMGNLLPGTGIFQKKANHTRDLAELAGPAGDLVKRGFEAAELALAGNLGGAATAISATAARNVIKAIDMGKTDSYRDDKGRKIIDTTLVEALAKGIGFQPRSVKNVQDASREAQKMKDLYTTAAGEIREKMAQAIYKQDDALRQEARDAVTEWNQNNPGQRMNINMPAVLKKVKEMRKSKEQRMADTAPKAIRSQVRAQLNEELH